MSTHFDAEIDALAVRLAQLAHGLQDVQAIDRNRSVTLDIAGRIYTARLQDWLQRHGERELSPSGAQEMPADVKVALGLGWDVDKAQREAIAEAHNLRIMFAELLPALEAPDPNAGGAHES